MMAAAIGMIIVALALLIFCVAVMWKVFCKAGEPGWASLIPFYNLYVMTIDNHPGILSQKMELS